MITKFLYSAWSHKISHKFLVDEMKCYSRSSCIETKLTNLQVSDCKLHGMSMAQKHINWPECPFCHKSGRKEMFICARSYLHLCVTSFIVIYRDVRVQSDLRFFALHKTPFSDFYRIVKHIFSGISDYLRLFLTDPLTPLNLSANAFKSFYFFSSHYFFFKSQS